MKKILIVSNSGDPGEMTRDLHKLFGFKVLKVNPCDALYENGELISGLAITYKTSKKKYENFLETRERYGF